MNEYDISLRIVIKGINGVEVKSIVRLFDYLEGALYQSDRKDVEELSQRMNLSNVIRDASLERLRQYRGQRLSIHSASSGSLILFGVVSGISLYVLKNTIGESMKEGWKNSEQHMHLTKVFQDLFDSKLYNLFDQIKGFISKYKKSNVRLVEVKKDKGSLIEIEIIEPDGKVSPTIGEMLESQFPKRRDV